MRHIAIGLAIMIKRLWALLTDWRSIRLVVVRRYTDANGAYVGELYAPKENGGYEMIGASLDTLRPVEHVYGALRFRLDTKNDFLAPIGRNVLRIGAHEPENNEYVRRKIASLPRSQMLVIVQNRFIEHVLAKKV